MVDTLQFYFLFNNISVITGLWEGDNERPCAIESRLITQIARQHKRASRIVFNILIVTLSHATSCDFN